VSSGDVAQLLRQAFAAQDRGQTNDAIRLYQQALSIDPRHPDALHELGLLYFTSERASEGLRLLTESAALAPDNARFQMNFGLALRAGGQCQRAIEPLRRVTELAPTHAEAFVQLGLCLRELGRYQESIGSFERALAINPGAVNLMDGIGRALVDQGRLDEAIAMYRRALAAQPNYAAAASNLLLALSYHDGVSPQKVAAEHFDFGRRFGGATTPPRPIRRPASDGRIRIGYLSGDFKQHSVSFFIWRVLSAHDRKRVAVTCYSDVARPDEVTRHLQPLPETWRVVAGMNDDQLAATIDNDQIDILVELAGHTGTNRLVQLARQRLAPIQVSYLGYPNTTGLSTIDYYITDSIADPPGMTESHFSERLVRLPGAFFCYVRIADVPDIVSPPAATRGYPTFGVFTNFAKVRPRMMQLWADILAALPNSRLLMQAKAMNDRTTRDTTLRFFTDRGLPAERIDLRPWLDFPQHVQLYKEVDVVLDTFPFNGHTTSCHALWMGTPLVTLAGATHRSRMGASILTNLGLPELVADSEQAYVRIATSLASDIPRMTELRMDMRDRMRRSVLVDEARFTRNLEDAYERMMRELSSGR
jgi:predicted O-linked N-acetylglucosamine transferase (SPINDLY family)